MIWTILKQLHCPSICNFQADLLEFLYVPLHIVLKLGSMYINSTYYVNILLRATSLRAPSFGGLRT